ncbi:cytochrome-c peroxidase [Chelatococcus sp. SYSU_G07232]|uniref:Cytochrome-c peroxidase n=1 Tax=Chelatococcus albus TaxID=3047466 RepID=A0ABT7AKB3_9HYPH|nr:cytochrome-c peroxidase [Chelatococcus sp. SYSU_G07232]MDJ1159810.1 cytochrome-c peroxidase [Chelatococcus sp. SYSU_G07232]
MALAACLALLAAATRTGAPRAAERPPGLAAFARPQALPQPLAPERVSLGRRLFRDTRLSRDGSFACDSCHYHGLAFSDARPRAVGVAGEPLARNTPALWNLAWARRLLWDGSLERLEDQVRAPVVHRAEMGTDWATVLTRLGADPDMRARFARAFPDASGPSETTAAEALAAYVRSLVSPVTRFDRWVAGEADALLPQEAEGYRLFTGKAGCAGCHVGWRLTDDAVREFAWDAAALRLRTPSLRELAWSGPYLHDGSAPTLAEALARHPRPSAPGGDSRAERLSEAERAALAAFLATLSSEDAPRPVPLP